MDYRDTHKIQEITGGDGLNTTERMLITELEKLGLNPIPQYPVGNCKLDIAFPDQQWAFEVNGPYHYTEEGKERDKRRRQFLHHTFPPWKIRSFSADKVFANPREFALKIKNIMEKDPEGGDNIGGHLRPYKQW